MSNHSPIPSPPPDLVKQWVTEVWHEGTPARLSLSDMHIATEAAQWGADQELEVCVNYIDNNMSGNKAREFRAIRRSKPPSLKEQALNELNLTADPDGVELSRTQVELIRKALEALDD